MRIGAILEAVREAITGERRRRLLRPKTLMFFGAVFLFLPFLNYFVIASRLGIHFTLPRIILGQLPFHTLFFLFAPFAVGGGLLLVKKWGWWLFLGYAVTFTIYNLVTLILKPDLYNAGALLNTVIFLSSIVYFSRKDISAPFFRMYPRGWRMQKRKPVQVSITVNGVERQTSDISLAGFFVGWEGCQLQPNDRVQVTLYSSEDFHDFEGGVVRVDDRGAGIAFRNLDEDGVNFIESIIGRDVLLRLSKNFPRLFEP